MNNFVVAAAAILFGTFATSQAFAFSEQTGGSVPGAFANIADPDEKTPPFLRATGGSGSAASDNFDDVPFGQGFISKDAIQQSIARGSGSYLPPADTQK